MFTAVSVIIKTMLHQCYTLDCEVMWQGVYCLHINVLVCVCMHIDPHLNCSLSGRMRMTLVYSVVRSV